MRKSLLVALALAAVLGITFGVHSRAAAALFAHAHVRGPHPLEHPFWDAEPYAAGINDYRAGRSPYHADDLANPLPFAYPPVFVWVGGALAKVLPSPWGWRVYVAIYLPAVFGLQMIMAFYLRRPVGVEWLAALGLLPLTPFLSTAFLSGNIHVLWYFAAGLAAIPGIRRNQWAGFYLLAFVAAMSQPVFILLLLFPAFAGARQYVTSAGTLAATAVAYAVEYGLNPAMYRQFQQTVAAHLAASHDYGQGVFGMLAGAGIGAIACAAVQICFSVVVVAVLVWLKVHGIANDRRWWALLILAVVLVNPRVMPYDAAIGLIPAAFFLVYDRPRGWLITLPVTAVCIVAHHIVGFTPVVLAGFAAGALAEIKSFAAASVRTAEHSLAG